MAISNQSFAQSLFEKNNKLEHQKAESAMAAGNFAIAYSLWEPLASKGDSKAQFNIGWMFHNGYGLAIDDSAAHAWWLLAAEQGYVEAFYTLADLYLAGFGVDKDKDIAMGWYIAAAEFGHKPSLEIIHELANRKDKLGQKYFKQLIFDDWFLRSAQQGDNISLNILLALASQKDQQSQDYFRQLLINHWSLFKQKATIKVARANIRKGPGTGYKIVTALKQNDELVVLTSKGKWTKIGLPKSGKIAWVFSTLIEPIPTANSNL